MKWFATIGAMGLGLLASVAVAAPVTVENFNSPGSQQPDPENPFHMEAIYASWGAPFATLSSLADRYQIRSHNYGSGYHYLGPVIDVGDNTDFQFNFTVSEGVAGCIVDLVDEAGNGQSYKFYGLVPGGGTNNGNDYTFTVPIAGGDYFSGTGVLNKHDIVNMNIEIDPGAGGSNFYTASFNDVTAVPEPATLAAGVMAIGALARRRKA